MANTPLRNVRIEDELWDAAQAAASEVDLSLSAVIRNLLTAWVARDPLALEEALCSRLDAGPH